MSRPKNMAPGYPCAWRSSASARRRLGVMADYDAIRRFADEATIEPDAIARARAHALEIGAAPISPVVGAQCAVLAAATDALNIVEIGTGGGVSGLWLLHGS